VAKDISSGSAVWKIIGVSQVVITPMTLWTPADPNIGMTYQPMVGMANGNTTTSTYNGSDCP
jgi:hypothetical protein